MKKMDISLEKLETIEKAVASLKGTQILDIVNCTMGIANCAISVAGTMVTLEKLNQIQQEFKVFYDKFDKNIKRKKIQTAQTDYKNLRSILENFKENFSNPRFYNPNIVLTVLNNVLISFITIVNTITSPASVVIIAWSSLPALTNT